MQLVKILLEILQFNLGEIQRLQVLNYLLLPLALHCHFLLIRHDLIITALISPLDHLLGICYVDIYLFQLVFLPIGLFFGQFGGLVGGVRLVVLL